MMITRNCIDHDISITLTPQEIHQAYLVHVKDFLEAEVDAWNTYNADCKLNAQQEKKIVESLLDDWEYNEDIGIDNMIEQTAMNLFEDILCAENNSEVEE